MMKPLLLIYFLMVFSFASAQPKRSSRTEMELNGPVKNIFRESSTLYCKNGFSYMNNTFSVSYTYPHPQRVAYAGRSMFTPEEVTPSYYTFDREGKTLSEVFYISKDEIQSSAFEYDSPGRVKYEIFQTIFVDDEEEEVLFSMERDIPEDERKCTKKAQTPHSISYQMIYDMQKRPVERIKYNGKGKINWRLIYRPDPLTPEIASPSNNTVEWEVEYGRNGLPVTETGLDQNGMVTQTSELEYDENNYPKTEYWLDADNNLYLTWHYRFDQDGNLTEIKVVKNHRTIFRWTLSYSEYGDILSLKRESGGKTDIWESAYEYDDYGNWVWQYQYKNNRPVYGIRRTIAYN